MPNLCVIRLMSAFLVMLLSSAVQLASAEERLNQSRMALTFDSTLNRNLPIIQRVCHQPVRNWLRRILPWRLSRVSTVRHTEGRM